MQSNLMRREKMRTFAFVCVFVFEEGWVTGLIRSINKYLRGSVDQKTLDWYSTSKPSMISSQKSDYELHTCR